MDRKFYRCKADFYRVGKIPLEYASVMKAHEHRLVVPRTARYLTLGELDSEHSGLSEVWFLCHGYGQLAAEFLDSVQSLASPHRLLVVPEALSRFYHDDHRRVGASWMTREDRDREMEDYIRYWDLVHDQIFELVERASTRLILLGFSQGAATAARWAVHGSGRVDHLVLWGAAVPPELDSKASLQPTTKMQLTLVRGTRDKIFSESDRDQQRSRLRQHGATFSELTFEGGHRLDSDTLLKLAASA